MKVKIGDTVRIRDLLTTDGTVVAVPDPNQVTHLQFRRFAGCPICNVHLQSVIARHDDIRAADIQEVVVFHSTKEELQEYADKMPFAVIGDSAKDLYRRFGVETSVRSILDPRAMLPVVKKLMRGRKTEDRQLKAKYLAVPNGGRIGLPAEMLIDGQGKVLAVKYGTHAYDQWSVDELLDLARAGVR